VLNWLNWSGHKDAQRARLIQILQEAGAKKQPRWWLEIRWGIAYRWTRVIRFLIERAPGDLSKAYVVSGGSACRERPKDIP
jgi:hypothetical protein